MERFIPGSVLVTGQFHNGADTNSCLVSVVIVRVAKAHRYFEIFKSSLTNNVGDHMLLEKAYFTWEKRLLQDRFAREPGTKKKNKGKMTCRAHLASLT